MRLALVIASADCWRDDLDRFRLLYANDVDVYVVNDAAWLYDGDVCALVTLHPENLDTYTRTRPDVPLILSHHKRHRFPATARRDDVEFFGHWGAGSSTLFAVAALLEKGYGRIVLCGAPMDSRPHGEGAGTWDGDPWPDREVQIHREGWTHHKDKLGGVRSMSGWTGELLGAPSRSFLYDSTPTHAAMAKRTVPPATTTEGVVTEAVWHCPACGDTAIHATSNGYYHCTSCGRDFNVTTSAVPWWVYTEDQLRGLYPEPLWRADGNG